MTAAREAFYLPLLFLTVVLAGSLHMTQVAGPELATRFALRPPSLFGLVLAMLLLGVLVRSGTLAAERLMNSSRSPLENLSGLVVVATMFLGSAQALRLATPEAGLPRLLVSVFLLVLLVNTLVAAPDRTRVLRSLLVIFGSAFTLKFVVLDALASPAGGRLKRVLQALLEGVTLGTLSQDPMHPAMGYIAFATLLLFLIGLAMLPARIAFEDVRSGGALAPPLPTSLAVSERGEANGLSERPTSDVP